MLMCSRGKRNLNWTKFVVGFGSFFRWVYDTKKPCMVYWSICSDVSALIVLFCLSHF